jgi:dissimilatory sulfite reductase (desulfoviridin) alpha/beta subunit
MALMDVIDRKAAIMLPASSEQERREPLPGMVEVNATTAEEVFKALEEAITVIAKTAAHHRMGVLVTRAGAGSYIVRAHQAVPYGLIRQQQE